MNEDIVPKQMQKTGAMALSLGAHSSTREPVLSKSTNSYKTPVIFKELDLVLHSLPSGSAQFFEGTGLQIIHFLKRH